MWTASGPLVGWEMDGIRDGGVEISYRFHCQCARAIHAILLCVGAYVVDLSHVSGI